MARGINKIILVGNVGQMDVKQNATMLSLATSENWTDKQTGQKQERTEWHRVVCFGKLAEITAQYVAKGSKLYIEGSLRTEKYTGQDGIERFTTKIIAREMQMLDSKKAGSETAPPPATERAPVDAFDDFDAMPF